MRKIEILAQGFTMQYYMQSGTETWTCNMGQFLGTNLTCLTKAFWMDDFGGLFFGENKKKIKRDWDGLWKLMEMEGNKKEYDIITCRSDPRWPWAHAYPLEAVIEETKCDWFADTVCYMIAHAVYEHARIDPIDELHFYGVDYNFTYENRDVQKECVTFWAGIAHGRGIKLKIHPGSFLLQKNHKLINGEPQTLYGFIHNPPRRSLI